MVGPSYIDLFAGAGGLSLGLSASGWNNLLAIDSWPDAISTYCKNFGSHAVWNVDISTVTAGDLFRRLEERPQWVVGGPPCQGFSTVGRRVRSDPRNRLFEEFRRVVKLTKPDGFLLENVVGLRDMCFVEDVRSAFAEIGYGVSFMVLRAADFGVPQLRHRVIFVGDRTGRVFSGPRPSHGEASFVSVWDAIGDLPALDPGEGTSEYDREPETCYQRAMRSSATCLQGHTASKHPAHLVKAISFIPDGGNRKSIPEAYQPRSGFHNSYSRLNSRAPAVAVTSNMSKPSATRCIHPFQNRGLTAREGARLQSFPDGFHFVGGGVSQRLQIANAVPPLLAAAVGNAIQDLSLWSDPQPAAGSRLRQPTLVEV